MSDFQRETTKSANSSDASTHRGLSVCTCGSAKSKAYELGTSLASRKKVSQGFGYGEGEGDQDILVQSEWEVTWERADERV